MNKKNIEINKNDYEKYNIPVSLLSLLPKRKEKYIYGELEKRHPCFSNDYSFFTKERLSKKGIVLDVFVIEKSKLGSYKAKSKTEKLYIDGNRISRVNSKRVKLIILMLIISFVASFIILLFYYKTNVLKKISERDKMEYVENLKQKEKITNYSDYNTGILQKFFNVIRNNEGIVKNLTWYVSMSGEYYTGSVDNIFPERLENVLRQASIKSINYINNKPYFDFSVANNFMLENINNKSLTIKNKEKLRSFLQDEKISLIQEINNPYKIIFDLYSSTNISKTNFLINLNSFLDKEKIYISNFNISSRNNPEKGTFARIELGISNIENYKNNLLKILGENIDLFYEKNVEKVKNKVNYNVKNSKTNENTILGEINYRSGKKIIYYKTPEGKIEKKEVS